MTDVDVELVSADRSTQDRPPAATSWRVWSRTVAALVGPALLVLAGTLPVWGMTLLAPQYPKGLALWFYGGRAEGPIREVNGLNHYIGMRPIDLALVPEMRVWPIALIGAVVVFLVAILARGWVGRIAAVILSLTPVIVLVDIQRWLYIFGSELDPGSALRLDPFVPLVLGPSTVWNFTVWAYPGLSLAGIWVVAALAFVVRRWGPAVARRDLVAAIAGLAIAVAGTVAVVIPAVRPAETPLGPSSLVPAASADLAAMVDQAPDGATVIVPAGRYIVHLDLQRPVTLEASGAVVLDGGGRGTPVTIRSDDVTIRGFTIVNTGAQVEDAAAIKTVDASRVLIEGNRIEQFFTGISINGGGAVHIVGNELVGSGQVIHGAEHATAMATASSGSDTGPGVATGDPADPHAGHGLGDGPGGQGDAMSIYATVGTVIRDNRIEDVRDAIYLNYAEEVLIDSNVVRESRYGVHAMFGSQITIFGNEISGNLSGLVFMYSTDVLAGRNVIVDARSPSTGYGVVVKDVVGLRLAENLIARNRVGIQAEGTVNRLASEATVISNRIESNDVGVALLPSADLVFGGNLFDANLTQVAALGPGVERHNFWEYQGVGNTWSDYAGYDLAGDGIGDLPYRASGLADVLITTDAAIAAFRTSPAMVVLGTAQAVWAGAAPPAVTDHSPRRDQVGTGAVPDRNGVAERPTQPWQLLGVSLLGVTGLAFVAPAGRAANLRRRNRGADAETSR
ncbi:MAG: NosD domain-containing protein [Candidatus Limnocylindrales bacterium]